MKQKFRMVVYSEKKIVPLEISFVLAKYLKVEAYCMEVKNEN